MAGTEGMERVMIVGEMVGMQEQVPMAMEEMEAEVEIRGGNGGYGGNGSESGYRGNGGDAGPGGGQGGKGGGNGGKHGSDGMSSAK